MTDAAADTLAVHALYPRRRRSRTYEFIEEFGGAGVLARPLPGGRVTRLDARGAAVGSAAAASIREAVEIGLLNEDWTFRIDIPDTACGTLVVAFTGSGHAVLGMSLAGGAQDRDTRATTLERWMRTMMAAFPAEACMLGDDPAVPWDPQQWSERLRALRADPSAAWPWYVRGEWHAKQRVRVDASASPDEVEGLAQAMARRGVPVVVETSYPVLRTAGDPWTVLVEAPLAQLRRRLPDEGAPGAELASLVDAIAGVMSGPDLPEAGDQEPSRGIAGLLRGPTARASGAAASSRPSGRVILHDIASGTQWIALPGMPAAAYAGLEPASGRGGVMQWTEPDGWGPPG